MRIGIITVHDSANFGSFLQAYALKTVLEEMGHVAKFIRTRSREEAKKVFLGNIKNPVKYIRNYSFNIERYETFLKEIDKLPEIALENVNDSIIDLVIIGSDELWNVNTPVFRKKHFYGIDIATRNIITYAISAGKATVEDLKAYPELIEGMKKLKKIFIRDEHTKNLVNSLIDVEGEFTCDPTFLIDVSKFDNDYINPIEKPYILVYSYNFDDNQRYAIIKFAREKNLLIVAPCLKQKWSDIDVNCSPLEFCKLIQGAKYVVTTTFHGTIFSILNKKQFVSIPASQKVEDVLIRTGMYNAKMDKDDSYEVFKEKLLTPLDFNISEKKILDMRKISLEKLENEIEKYRR